MVFCCVLPPNKWHFLLVKELSSNFFERFAIFFNFQSHSGLHSWPLKISENRCLIVIWYLVRAFEPQNHHSKPQKREIASSFKNRTFSILAQFFCCIACTNVCATVCCCCNRIVNLKSCNQGSKSTIVFILHKLSFLEAQKYLSAAKLLGYTQNTIAYRFPQAFPAEKQSMWR